MLQSPLKRSVGFSPSSGSMAGLCSQSAQSLRFAGALIVPLDFNSQFWSYLTTGNLLENDFNIYVLCVKH